ncbi:protein of unknown function DUF2795 [Geotalea daltonii FRC-32]|uniref:DUF2795 domain-containing protein n=1 Tax=Geotalea daltonii (strain DSM 22248 / JCM 15807 / FRC-32) TaxID=316067 RepID=B9M990_GEODF|nr:MULTISPECIES: DUF2795 domain-containing protein [Geotalea]ACM18648.1 protein of unknown function DUF2795 [Geotalea daltonii FRC-32]
MAPGNVGRGGGQSPANVTKNLKGISFPASKQDLIKHAQHEHADREVISQLQNFEEREYGSMADVMKSYGKEHQGSSRSKSSQQQSQQSKKG